MVIASIAAVVLIGAALVVHGWPRYSPPPQPTAAQGLASGPPSASPSGAATPLPPATPTRVRIPVIGVNAPLTGLSLLANGHLDAPPEADRNLAGWYQAGITPGESGTAVIAGHVDNTQGPAVFYNLGALKKGWTIDVDRADHTTAVFTIDAVQAYAASSFPTQQVYGQTADPELRLITCGAGFDKSRQEYLGNVVVFAHLTGSTRSKSV
ncbi:class F sortase [Streptacidiphilus pinicola]|uniref:Class F sortase n=1 Tax=Streptacidiphilus pinicola TaxID=2219663 RepID=A0A2X0K543_9ACTN|nr:class F sortase [Streptacidiphilus pinicola]